MSERVTINGVDLVLTPPDDHESEWIDFGYPCSESKPPGFDSPSTNRRSTHASSASRG